MRKVAYCGIDALCGCLKVLLQSNISVAKVFAFSDDPFDNTSEICAIAGENGIPFSSNPITRADIAQLEQMGVELLVVAGCAVKIPLSDKMMQVNIHPSLLPDGRGPWPMPVQILRGIPSGVTLHKLSEAFDAGDILLQQKIPLAAGETLISLTEKIKAVSEQLLAAFLQAPEKYWKNAVPQQGGAYWPEPTDADRTLTPASTAAEAEVRLRAFCGYGVLYEANGVLMEIPDGKITAQAGEGISLPLKDGFLQPQQWHPYFRPICLDDMEKMETLRKRFPSALSDYTFSLLYCWQKTLKLQVYLDDRIFAVRGEEGLFCPIGEWEAVVSFLDLLLHTNGKIKLSFCDENQKARLLAHYGAGADAAVSDADSDYLISVKQLCDLPGSALASRRNAVRHYMRLDPAPVAEPITEENLNEVLSLAADDRYPDSAAQMCGLTHFQALKLKGALVRRGGKAVSFCTMVEQSPNTIQGQFVKCTDAERGAELFAMQAGVRAAGEAYRYVNMEDDMGVEGIRRFKQSLCPERVFAYTVVLSAER